jgi:acyl-CoA thioester hydrolase
MRDDNEGRTHAAAAESHAHVTTHRLRFNDTDRLGHVNNAVFAVMLEQGRSELMAEAGMPIGDGPQAVVIVRLELDFVAEMNWPGDIRIETEVSRLGGRSFQLRQRLISGGALCGQGITVLVVMDRAARKAVPIDPWRDSLTRWAAAEA